ncbi:MAG: GIY-YIG nuclease family protein [Lachnospiraceae bacterium]|nr:GIY-YIG nuclease family protein [Lachnospiraceae bacterium]
MILLNDILNFSKDQLKDIKIRFNQSNGDDFDPITLFKERNQRLYDGQFWNYSKAKSFKAGQIAIGFVKIETKKWLLFDISEITKDLEKYDAVGYEYRTLEEYRKYFGRLIVGYSNKSQNMIRKAESVIEECIVLEIIDDIFEDDIFPGYENVNLSWNELNRIIEKKDWKTALENQKGVYLITDIATGKRYVGSAYGKDMLLGRWRNYVDNGHGGNVELMGLPMEYIKTNFRYSVLDIYKSTTNDNVIINRESHWKRVLLTRDERFGYNKN